MVVHESQSFMYWAKLKWQQQERLYSSWTLANCWFVKKENGAKFFYDVIIFPFYYT
jgi:hypothetical protein